MTPSDERRQQAEELAAEKFAALTTQGLSVEAVLRELVILGIANQIQLEEIMSNQETQATIAAQEELDIQALVAAVPSLQNGINSLNTALANAIAAGQEVDPALAQAATDLHNAVVAVQGITVPTPPPATTGTTPATTGTTPATTGTTPAGGTAAPTPTTGTTTGTTTDPNAPAPTTGTAPTAPAGGSVASDPASGLPLYTYIGTGTPDPTAWTAVTDVRGAVGETLYTFNGDTAGSAPTGASADWQPYTGTTVAVSAPAGGTATNTGTAASGAGGSGGATTIDLGDVGIATTVIADPTRW